MTRANQPGHTFPIRNTAMPKFMSSHTLPPGAMKREQVEQLAEAAKSDPVIKPYRSFCNLSEGKIFCVMEAPDKQSLSAWFAKMKVPCDAITAVELEGERGTVANA
jgi:Protein of unknown function (DUF4242)